MNHENQLALLLVVANPIAPPPLPWNNLRASKWVNAKEAENHRNTRLSRRLTRGYIRHMHNNTRTGRGRAHQLPMANRLPQFGNKEQQHHRQDYEGGGGGICVRTMRCFCGGLPRMGWLLLPHKMPPKESKPLGSRTMYTSLCLALYVAPQGENTEDGPLGATTTLVGVSLLDCQLFLPQSNCGGIL